MSTRTATSSAAPSSSGTETEKLSNTDLAYIAGVIDPKARLWTRPTSASKLPIVEMAGPDMRLLSWLAGLTNTKAIPVYRSYFKAGCAEHCSEKHQHIVSVSGRWSVTGVKATVVLYNILPYMRLQAPLAGELVELGLQAGWKPQTISDMRALGWEIPAR